MPNNRLMRCGLGVLFWTAVLSAAWIGTRQPDSSDASPLYRTLISHLSGPAAEIVAWDKSSRLRPHDPVFIQEAGGGWQQVGHVRFVGPRLISKGVASSPDARNLGDGSLVQLAWYDREPQRRQYELIQYRSSGRLDEVLAVMLPPDQRQKISHRLSRLMAEHGEELAAAYLPLVQETLRQSLPIIEDEFRGSVQRHRNEVDKLFSRWNEQVVRERLVPLARREIVPIVRKHGEAPVQEIGRELWNKASLWRFGWRAVYDRSPLPQHDLVQEEWDRFVQEQAIPVFESHMDEIVVAVQQIISDVAANPNIRGELSEVASEIAADPEAQSLVRTILKETLVNNQRLKEAWQQIWTSSAAEDAFQLTGDQLEPVARQIGNDLFGTREGGINPNFARVLRNQILGKDRRWIIARPIERTGADQAFNELPVIKSSNETMPYPVVYLANENASL